jgi:hypothetical protein
MRFAFSFRPLGVFSSHNQQALIVSKSFLGLKANQKGTIDMVSYKIAGPYACDDAFSTWCLYNFYVTELEKEGYTQHFWHIDMPYNCGVLFAKEREGIKVDQKKLTQLEKEIRATAEEVKSKAFSRLGFDFNMNSSDQMRHVVFEILRFPKIKETASGDASTAKEVVEELCSKLYTSKKKQEAVETLKILVQRTPSYDLPLKWNLLRLLGALEDPAAADFLAGVAIEPVPEAAGHNGGSRYDGELRVRTMAIEALLQIAARHKTASESLLRVVAARPVRPILVEALKAASELGLNASVRRLLPADDRRSA